MGYRMVFDRENLRFSWSRWNCQDRASFSSPYSVGSPNPLPVDQQQSFPNAHGVPPAIAGHTSPKPSAATPELITSRHSLVSLLLICHLWLWLFC
ncbi:hypothetical protein JHK87_040281 [Glycine soja]|nr:hypothetical protein JHK87_040281 [Glycine soja]